MAKINKIFAKNLKKARNQLGYSQMKLAELSNCSTGLIAEFELGKSFPSANSLEKIVKALGIKPYQLFLEDSDEINLDKYDLLMSVFNEFKDTLQIDWEKIIKKHLK